MLGEKRARKKAQAMGYDTVKYVGLWHGFGVYDYYNEADPEGLAIGLPSFILATEGGARITQDKEAFRIIDDLDSDE